MDKSIYRWIYPQIGNYKGKIYKNYIVMINQKYMFCSQNLKNCEEFVIRFAKKNNIPESKILKNGKHPRITKNC